MIDFQKYYDELCLTVKKNCQKKISVNSALGVYLGIGDNGYLRLSFMSSCHAPRLESTAALLVVQGEEANGIYWTCFDLVQLESKAIFFAFCENMIEAIIDIYDEKTALEKLKRRYISWKSMFKSVPKSKVSRELIQGLFGELYFLRKYMIEHYGVAEAINGWSGPDAKSKDFSVDKDWYEVKTVGSNAINVHISSLTQLSSEYDGHLVIVKVEAMSSQYVAECSCIADLMKEILSLINDETIENIFLTKLSTYGNGLLDIHMNEKFSVKSVMRYKVDSKFPRITESDIALKEVCEVSYSLIISTLRDYAEE